MAEDKTRRSNVNNEPLEIEAHKEPEKIAAHQEPAQLTAAEDIEAVPVVTADVDETPRFVRYGAAVLLGLAFGVGCYVWLDGMPERPYEKANIIASTAPTAENYSVTSAPNPFNLGVGNANKEYVLFQVPRGTAFDFATLHGANSESNVNPVAVISGCLSVRL